MVPDSPSYLQYPLGQWPEMAEEARTPGYPLLLALVRLGTEALWPVPIAQVLLHVAAAWALATALRGEGMPAACRGAVALAVGLAATIVDHVGTIATDAPAASLGVLTAAGLLAWARSPRALGPMLLVALAASGAIFVRPAYLFLPAWIAVAGTLLRRRREVPWRPAAQQALVLAAIASVLPGAWVAARWSATGDLGFVPFGGENLAGVTVQLADSETLRGLPGDAGVLGAEIAWRMEQYAAEEPCWPPLSDRSYMAIEARWDDLVWHVIVPAARDAAEDRSQIAQHRRLQALNRQLLARHPERYLVWIAKAGRQSVRVVLGNAATQPHFLAALLLLALWCLKKGSGAFSASPPGLDSLLTLAIPYYFLAIAVVIATSPPIGRLADPAGLFFPPLIAAWWIGAVRRSRRDHEGPSNRGTACE